MSIEPEKVIAEIARFTVPQIINQAQRSEIIIKVLKSLKIDALHPPKDFYGIYAYALVEYGVDKPKSILKAFREKDIRGHFWRSFCLDDFDSFTDKVLDFINYRDIGDEIIKDLGLQAKLDLKQDILPFINEFYKVFTNVVKLTRTPTEVMRDTNFRENLETLNKLSTNTAINTKLVETIGLIPNISPYPEEFKALIKEKSRTFCGRKFVFNAIEYFFTSNVNGYFTIVGDAGMGKSAIAAKYILDNPEAVCFFNVRAEGMNRPELFLKKIRQQLMNRYQLENITADTDLTVLLLKVSEKITASERLVIVVDALDEVDQESAGNLLYLPTTLPKSVYFLLTRRPYNQNEKKLSISPNITTKELDLRDYSEKSIEDVKEYISLLLHSGDYKEGLNQWIQKRSHLSVTDFVEKMSLKSENNFMYLRCILPAIAEGFYDNQPLDELPVGLQGYYENHWRLMGMTSKPLPKNRIKIIYVMCALRSAASRKVIAKYSKQNELTVQEVLEGWAQFLHKHDIYSLPRYRFYHESFRDFLHRQDIVQAAGVSLPDISAEVADIMIDGLPNYE